MAESLLRSIVDTWERRCSGRRTIAFAADIEHSRRLVEAFRGRGVTATHVDGQTPQSRRGRIFADFAEGRITVLSSVNVLSEGFDEPGVECVLLLRPTNSKGLFIQQVGRGLRVCPGKRDCIVLDQAGNTMRHGSIVGPPSYALEEGLIAMEDQSDRDEAELEEEAGGGDVERRRRRRRNEAQNGDWLMTKRTSGSRRQTKPALLDIPPNTARGGSRTTSTSRAMECPRKGCGCVVHPSELHCPLCGASLRRGLADRRVPELKRQEYPSGSLQVGGGTVVDDAADSDATAALSGNVFEDPHFARACQAERWPVWDGSVGNSEEEKRFLSETALRITGARRAGVAAPLSIPDRRQLRHILEREGMIPARPENAEGPVRKRKSSKRQAPGHTQPLGH